MLWLLTAWGVSAVSIWVTAEVLPGFSVKNGFGGLLVVAAILGLLNAVLGGILFFVIGIGTLGIGWLLWPITQCVVTAILLVVTDKLSDSLKIRSFGMAFVGAIVMTIIYSIAMRVLGTAA
jgi:putative membrane protein